MRYLILPLLLAAACQTPTDKTPPPNPGAYKPVLDPKEKPKFVSQEQYAEHVKRVRQFVKALYDFNSSEPAQWEGAFQTLDELHYYTQDNVRKVFQITDGIANPKSLEEFSDWSLIELARGRDARRADEARKELGLRGKIIILCWKFDQPYTLVDWETAKKSLVQVGDRGKLMLAYALMSVIVSQRQTDWPYARYYMAELGELGFAVVKAYFDTVLMPHVPEGSIGSSAGFMFHKDKVEQCLMALLQLGPVARDYFLTLTRSARPWIRRSVAISIVQARDVSRFDVLLQYATQDPDEDVRATTFSMLGKMSYARDEAGPILIQALAVEKAESCLSEITKGLVELDFRGGVPKLIDLLDHPDYPVVRNVMDALDSLTGTSKKLGHKLQTPADWKKYWEEKLKPSWK